MSKFVIQPKKLKGTITLPPSKSLAHRAIIAASLARGRSVIKNIEYSKDIKATIQAMKALGTMIFEYDDYLEIDGTTTFMKSNCEINCYESGSTLRFLIPLSLVYENNLHFIGEGRLGKRPIDTYYNIFDKQGIGYLYREDVLDLYVRGQLYPDVFEIPGDVSSQFISGLLFALPLMNGDSVIKVTSPLESKAYIDLTLDILDKFGIRVMNNQYKEFIVFGNQSYRPTNYEVESDFSQAAFYLCAGALGNQVSVKGMNLDSKQGDKAMIDILKFMGCVLNETQEGISVYSGLLSSAIKVDGSQYPDIIPVIALCCALSHGVSEIVNISRLRIKESDRLSATVEMINLLGGIVIEQKDAMIIQGVSSLHGGSVSAYNDHRMAMLAAIASTVCENAVVIDNKDCVEKSYPSFWDDFKSLGGEVDEFDLGD